MKFDGIDHLEIICSNYPRSRTFYVTTLGLEVIREYELNGRQKLNLRVGKDVIKLSEMAAAPQRLDRPEALGLRHFAFSTNSFDEVIKVLVAEGVEIEHRSIDPANGKQYAFFRDPDNLPIELCEV